MKESIAIILFLLILFCCFYVNIILGISIIIIFTIIIALSYLKNKKNNKKEHLELEAAQKRQTNLIKEQQNKKEQLEIRKAQRKEALEKLKLEEENFILKNSQLCNELIKLNQNYLIDMNVCKQHNFLYDCQSKKEYDNIDYEKILIKYIRNDLEFFNEFAEIVNMEEIEYNKYCDLYDNLKQYSIKEQDYKFNLPFNKFKNLEEIYYIEHKKNKFIYPSVKLTINYKTPSLRNFYEKHIIFPYDSLIEIINKANQPEPELKKSRYSNMLEQIKQQQQILQKQQEEFLKATQNHIYSSNTSNDQPTTKQNKNASLSQKLKELRNQYDNYEISFAEYTKRKRELMKYE